MEAKRKQKIKQYGSMVGGACLIAIGLYFFWAPSHLAAGGISGLSIVIKAILPNIPIGIIMFALDGIMFIIGFLILGKSFGARSLICSGMVSGIMTILEWIWPHWESISQDVLIVLIFGALFISFGQAFIFNAEASSGGTDILAKVLSQYTHLNIGISLLVTDMLVVILAIRIFGLEKGLYAALGVIIVTYLIDYIIEGLNVRKYVVLIPSSMQKAEEIKSFILVQLERGVTIYKAEGGYSGEEKCVMTTVMNRKEFLELKKQVMQMDDLAFMTVQNMHEVVGEGFNY